MGEDFHLQNFIKQEQLKTLYINKVTNSYQRGVRTSISTSSEVRNFADGNFTEIYIYCIKTQLFSFLYTVCLHTLFAWLVLEQLDYCHYMFQIV